MQNQTNGKAIVSLIFSILWLGGIGSLIGVLLGHSARKEIIATQQGGLGLTTASLTLGYLFGIPTLLFFLTAVWAINFG